MGSVNHARMVGVLLGLPHIHIIITLYNCAGWSIHRSMEWNALQAAAEIGIGSFARGCYRGNESTTPVNVAAESRWAGAAARETRCSITPLRRSGASRGRGAIQEDGTGRPRSSPAPQRSTTAASRGLSTDPNESQRGQGGEIEMEFLMQSVHIPSAFSCRNIWRPGANIALQFEPTSSTATPPLNIVAASRRGCGIGRSGIRGRSSQWSPNRIGLWAARLANAAKQGSPCNRAAQACAEVAKILNEGGSRGQAGPSCGFQETWRLMRRKTKKEKEEEVTCMKRESKTHGKKTWPRHAATHTLSHTHRQIDPHRKPNRCCNWAADNRRWRTPHARMFSAFFHVSSEAAGAISSARGGTGGCTCASKVWASPTSGTGSVRGGVAGAMSSAVGGRLHVVIEGNTPQLRTTSPRLRTTPPPK